MAGWMLKIKDWNICRFNASLFLGASLLMTPVLLLFYQENGLSAKDLFFFQGIFYIISILLEIPIGYLSDKITRRNLLVISFSILLVISAIWLFYRGYWAVLIGEILFAVSKVMRDNSNSGYLYDYLNSKNMIKYYGYSSSFLAAGASFGALFGTYLFAKYGSKILLSIGSFLFLAAVILVLSLPDIRKEKTDETTSKQKFNEFVSALKEIYNNKSIMYYVLYSGLLTSFSILFALSFQPLMNNAMVPIALFGIIAFINNGVRALSGLFAGKFLRDFKIKKFIIPLYILYYVAFGCIFAGISTKSHILEFSLLCIICLIIGCQLAFTILHVSRIHKFVSIEHRGGLMSINNIVSRSMAGVMLISSKWFINKVDLTMFFVVCLMIFVIFGTSIMIKTYKVE